MNEAPPVAATEVQSLVTKLQGLEAEVQNLNPAAAVAQSPANKLAESLKTFQRLTDSKARKDFYDKHPELAAVYSAVNFHTA